jgi:hypothetical protein
MPFQSQAQWRWAFATGQEFADRWAKMTPGGKRRFALLAKRKRTTKASTPNNPALWARAIAQAKRKFDVYPSAYANGWAAKWYKANGGTWSTQKDLRNWFNEKWVNIARPIRENGEIVGFEPCGRSDGEGGYPKCMPLQKAMRLSDAQRKTLIQRKRRGGLPQDGAPTMTSSATLKHLPGKHDQADHGKPGRVGTAFRGAYSSARAEGKNHREARDAAKTAAEQVRQTMRDEKRADLAANPKPKRPAPARTETPTVSLNDKVATDYMRLHNERTNIEMNGGDRTRLGDLIDTQTEMLNLDRQTPGRPAHKLIEDQLIARMNEIKSNPEYQALNEQLKQSSQLVKSLQNERNLAKLIRDKKRLDAEISAAYDAQIKIGENPLLKEYSETFLARERVTNSSLRDYVPITSPIYTSEQGWERLLAIRRQVEQNAPKSGADLERPQLGTAVHNKLRRDYERTQQERLLASDYGSRMTNDQRTRAVNQDIAARQRLDDYERRATTTPTTPTTKATTTKHLPGKHNQADHGRKGPAGTASRSAYTTARAAGASHREALDAGKRASGEVRQAEQQQRNVSRAAQLRERANRLSPQAETTTTPAKPLAQQDGGLGLTGTPTKAYGVDPNTSYRMTHRIVEMDDLIPSNTRGGGVNPAYDAELQPRDRRRSSSQAQIDKIARGLNPEVMTEDFKRIDAGSPIIDARGMVLSGNGRTLALQRHEDGSAYPGKQSEYRDEVLRVAKDLGIDPAEVAKMKNPVVVRQLEPNVDPVAFAREANSSGTLRMSPIEQARVDAEAMPQSTIAKLKSEDGQTLDAALRSSANKEFINAFLKVVPDNERASLLTADGELNPVGLYRAKAAVYTATFQSDSGDRMARSLLDSLDPDLASVQAGLSGALPQLSSTVSTTRTSNPALDPSNDIATAVDTLARIRGNPGLAGVPAKDKVQVYLEQSNMFNEGQKHNLTDAQVELLVHIDSIASRPARVRDYVQDIAKMIDAQPAEGQGGFFGGPLSLTEIYASATQASRERGKRTEEAKPKKPDESNTTAPSEPKPKLQLGDAIPKRSRGSKPKADTTTKAYAVLVSRLQRI